MRLTPDTLARIERHADKLRAEAQAANARAWKLDSALSLYRKALLGYRANPALGDAPWDADAYGGKLLLAYLGD